MKRVFAMKIMAILMLALGLCACGRSTPTNYYLLESSPGQIQAESLPAGTLRVAMVEGPNYLNRNNIVSRVKGEPRLILAEFHLWAEPVTNGVRRVIAETLTKPLLADGITVLPPGSSNGGDYVLLLDIQRLDGNFDEKAVLECHWSLLDKNEKALGSGIYSSEEMVRGANYNALVDAESRLVRRMGDYLAQKLLLFLHTGK